MITCIGIGPGDMGYLTRHGEELIRSAEVVTAFTAVLDFAKGLFRTNVQRFDLTYRNQETELAKVAELHHAGKRCVVLFMGDPHFSGFQLLERVDKACGEPTPVVPGISSAQLLASKARVCFDETTFITFHRRGDLEPFKRHLVHALQDNRNAIVIPRPWDLMPRDVCAYLIEQGLPKEHPVEVWEHLSKGEAHWTGTLGHCVQEFSDMSIILIRTLHPMPSQI